MQRQAMIVSNATGYRLVDENGMTFAEAEYATDGTSSYSIRSVGSCSGGRVISYD